VAGTSGRESRAAGRTWNSRDRAEGGAGGVAGERLACWAAMGTTPAPHSMLTVKRDTTLPVFATCHGDEARTRGSGEGRGGHRHDGACCHAQDVAQRCGVDHDGNDRPGRGAAGAVVSVTRLVSHARLLLKAIRAKCKLCNRCRGEVRYDVASHSKRAEKGVRGLTCQQSRSVLV